jgi:hypothetical protein
MTRIIALLTTTLFIGLALDAPAFAQDRTATQPEAPPAQAVVGMPQGVVDNR